MVSKKELSQSKYHTLNLQQGSSSSSEAIVILVIGESFNKYHSELYGYKLHTNPHMAQELRNGNLFVFSDVVTPYNMTSHVMKNLFSVNSLMDNESWGMFPIFPAIFRDAGFKVLFGIIKRPQKRQMFLISLFFLICMIRKLLRYPILNVIILPMTLIWTCFVIFSV